MTLLQFMHEHLIFSFLVIAIIGQVIISSAQAIFRCHCRDD